MDDCEDLICEEHSHVSKEIQGSQKDENWNKWEIYRTEAQKETSHQELVWATD
jgi:hypothetical protein